MLRKRTPLEQVREWGQLWGQVIRDCLALPRNMNVALSARFILHTQILTSQVLSFVAVFVAVCGVKLASWAALFGPSLPNARRPRKAYSTYALNWRATHVGFAVAVRRVIGDVPRLVLLI